MKSIGISTNHGSGITFVEDNEIKIVFPFDQFYNIKHSFIDIFIKSKKYRNAENYFINKYFSYVDSLFLSCELDYHKFNMFKVFTNLKYRHIDSIHHKDSHALSVSRLENKNNCLCVVIDSGGNGRVTFYSYNDGKLTRLYNSHDKLYGLVYNYVSRIVINSVFGRNDNDQDTPGKLMGYASFGHYNNYIADKLFPLFDWPNCNESYILKKYIDIILKLEPNMLADFCFTFQHIWINHILNEIDSFRNGYENICVSGGCFLNCHLNRELYLKNWFKDVVFTPVPGDSGLHLGSALNGTNINSFTPFIGPFAFDIDQLSNYKLDFKFRSYNYQYIAELIYHGKIIGTVYDRLEIGPRALGHRSILASPLLSDMKDKLNSKVKHRESYRPFGGVISRRDINKYFDMDISSRYMNVVVQNKTNKFPAITHIDNSTRIQTVTMRQDYFMYSLLKAFESVSGYPVILNTSFNVAGKPIINRLGDAFNMLKEKKIDGLIIDDLYFSLD